MKSELWPTCSQISVPLYIYIYISLLILFFIYFYSRADLVALRWAYKHVREIARRMEFYRGDLQGGHPAFAEDSQAAAATLQAGSSTPVDISAPKIVYSKEDDDAIDEFHRRSGSFTQLETRALNWH